MRLWSIHPQYLDSKGLVALWRETLLAQNVLLGKTKGYKNHPQLNRFKVLDNPLGGIANYLQGIEQEAKIRHYNFDSSKISPERISHSLNVTSGQINFELSHLKNKLIQRDPEKLAEINLVTSIAPHPLFKIVKGDIELWEIL